MEAKTDSKNLLEKIRKVSQSSSVNEFQKAKTVSQMKKIPRLTIPKDGMKGLLAKTSLGCWAVWAVHAIWAVRANWAAMAVWAVHAVWAAGAVWAVQAV